MPLPDERPRASVANLIGRFERTAQRRASSGELAKAAQPQGSQSPSFVKVGPRPSVKETPSWIKGREKFEKEKEAQNAEKVRSPAVQSNDPETPILNGQPQGDAGATAPPDAVVEHSPSIASTPPADSPVLPETPPAETPVVKAPAPKSVLKPTGSSVASSAFISRIGKSDSTAHLKATKSMSTLKSQLTPTPARQPPVNPPTSYKLPVLKPLKPQHTGPSSTTTTPVHRPTMPSSSSASGVRRPVPANPPMPERAKTPLAPRSKTPSARPKTPSALHAPTASSLAKLKTLPVPSSVNSSPKRIVSKSATQGQHKPPESSPPVPSSLRRLASSQTSPAGGHAAKSVTGRKPLVLSNKAGLKSATTSVAKAAGPSKVPASVEGKAAPVDLESNGIHSGSDHDEVFGTIEDEVVGDVLDAIASNVSGDQDVLQPQPNAELGLFVAMLEGQRMTASPNAEVEDPEAVEAPVVANRVD